METIRYLIKSSGRKPLLAILVSLLLLATALSWAAPSQSNVGDDKAAVRQMAQKWIQIGADQYKSGYFRAAKQSFLRAQNYEEYFTADEREKLAALVEKTQTGILEREHILEVIRMSDELVKRGELAKAKFNLENVKDSEFLTKEERELIRKGLEKLEAQLKAQGREVKPEVGSESPIADVARELLGGVDVESNKIAQRKAVEELEYGKVAQRPAVKEPSEQDLFSVLEKEMPSLVTPKPAASESSYIGMINRQRSIRQSHTKAVVDDAVAKVQEYINKDEFDKAKEEVNGAERVVNEYKLDLGEELFKQYSDALKQLAEKIDHEQEERALQLQEEKRLEAMEAQRKYREQMEIDRKKRIAELMDNAVAYQSQQRYTEALGQLESLLAIDPLNNQALVLKQTLEDMVSFSKQLEIQRESGRERAKTLIENDETMIPYAEELMHPKDWRKIIASPFRKPDEPIGRDPADAVVYRQLDEIVNLTQLTPEMPFSEAVEILKNSVDPPLKIFVNWRDLFDNADIDQTTPINMDPISAVPLRKALDLLLDAVSGGFVDISFVVEGGVITIATTASLPSEMLPLVYDITDIIGRPADFYTPTIGAVTAAAEGEAGTEELEVETVERQQLIDEATVRADNLVLLIQQTIDPDSWYEAGGDGTITVYERKKLIIHQTREVHNKIGQLLGDLRKSLGHQVAIEARFLVVGENFLEDIGLDVDFDVDVGGRVGLLSFRQESAEITQPQDTGITGSLTQSLVTDLGNPLSSLEATGGYGDLILNDLEVSIILRATQAHRDAQSVTAPKVTVLNGEMATMRVLRFRRYPFNIETDLEEIGDQGAFRYTVDYEQGVVTTGTLLNITPIITPDKKHVLLNIVTEMREFLGFEPFTLQLPLIDPRLEAGSQNLEITMPDTEISRVETRVSVPDRATLLLGGQRISAEVDREAGVPVLSKVPVLGRLFTNRSKVKDNLILLILVKPTIILREEAEANAIAAMESNNF